MVPGLGMQLERRTALYRWSQAVPAAELGAVVITEVIWRHVIRNYLVAMRLAKDGILNFTNLSLNF